MAGKLRKWGLKQQPWHYQNKLRDYPMFMLFYVCHGELEVQVQGRPGLEQTLENGQMLVMPPGSDFDLATPNMGYKGYYIEADPDCCPLPAGIRICDWDAGVARCIQDLGQEYQDQTDADLLPLLYGILLQRSLRLMQADRPQGQTDLASIIDSRLHSHIYTDAHLEQILADLPYSQRHLRRSYVAARGRSPKQSLLALKIQTAQELLTRTQLSVTCIAMELGFPSSQHFATTFAQQLGTSPRQYRQKS